MSLVVEEFPFGEGIVGDWTNSKVRVAKGFNTSAKEGIFKTKINSTLPDDTTDIKRVRTADTNTRFSLSNDVLSFLRKTVNFQGFDLSRERDFV